MRHLNLDPESPVGLRIRDLSTADGVSDFYLTPGDPLSYKFNGHLIFDEAVFEMAIPEYLEPGCDLQISKQGAPCEGGRHADKAKMRISSTEAETICGVVTTYDKQATVKLFGSQAREDGAGGDIDLLIFSSRIGLAERLQIECDLQDALGLRRFDLVVARQNDRDPFVDFVNKDAVVL